MLCADSHNCFHPRAVKNHGQILSLSLNVSLFGVFRVVWSDIGIFASFLAGYLRDLRPKR